MFDKLSFGLVINLLFVLSVLAQVVSIWSFRKVYNKNNAIMRVLRDLFVSALFLCVLYTFAIYADSVVIAQVLFCISLVFYNAVIFFFFVYSNAYTGTENLYIKRIIIVGMLMIGDAISLIISIFTRHIIYASPIEIAGSIVYRYDAGPFHNIHYAISVFTVLYGIGKLFLKAAKVPRSYKKRYINVSLSVIIVLVVNMLFHFLGVPIDLSGIILPFAIVIIYYYSIVFSPSQFLKESRAAVINRMYDGILIFDVDGVYRNSNKSAKTFLGIEENDPNEHNKVLEWIEKSKIDIFSSEVKEYIDTHLVGEPTVEVSAIPYYEPKSPDVQSGCFVRIHDKTDEIQKRQEAIYNATHDGLTGLLNRDAFFDSAQKYLEDVEELDHYLVCANIENFKLYNDLFGVGAGDELLKNIGIALEENIPDNILIGRMEADRFSVLISRKDFSGVDFQRVYAEALGKSQKVHYSINAYLGVYEINSLDEPVATIYVRSLMAAQAIKGNPDAFVSYYDKSITDSVLEEQKKIDELRLALANEEFEFFIQPQVTTDGRVLGGEALVRWNHPQNGIVTPFSFIGIMEKHGMIAALDQMVWRKVCKKLEQWKKDNITDFYISVNISTKDFFYMDVYETFIGLANEYDIDKSKLKLEITESAIMQNEEEQIDLIEKLRDAGFTVEMDDFGSGYSSLNMLNKMPVDVLKLDMGFLETNADENRTRTIVQNIQNLAKDLNMLTIAEGVETKEQADFLTSIGCDILQGYLFSPPVSISEFEEKYIK